MDARQWSAHLGQASGVPSGEGGSVGREITHSRHSTCSCGCDWDQQTK